ncbi:MAG: SDR family NAD(P)-dependent oxidoreductase [Mycobacteriales bacterium]
MSSSTVPGRPRDVLVTGAAGGLGAATCRRLAASGWRVFAADLVPPPAAPGIIPVQVDVTDDASVTAAVEKIAAEADGLAGVVHFAGILRVGGLLDVDAEVLRQVLDVNVLGAHRVTRAAFPLLQRGGGRVVLISSETGVQSGAPFNGPYAMSKHTVEAYGDSLRRELMFLGVPVIKVQPGPFRTDMVASVVSLYERATAASQHHRELLEVLLHRLPKEQAKAHDPDVLAAVVERALTAKRWRAAYLVRPDRARMLLDRLPTRTADRVLRLAITTMQRRNNRGAG